MKIVTVSVVSGGDTQLGVLGFDNINNKHSPCECYQRILEHHSADVICYAHDDLTFEVKPTEKMVLSIMEANPNCVAVGLGGATSLGRPDLYKTRYRIENMARGGYASNQYDAETHGERFTGTRRVAVLDAFYMAVRVDWLHTRQTAVPSKYPTLREGISTVEVDVGWPTRCLTHHCLDLWLACEAARDNKEIWMVGLPCHHHGGGTSTKPSYAQAKWLQGGTIEEDHRRPHRWLYEEYRDVLPITVPKQENCLLVATPAIPIEIPEVFHESIRRAEQLRQLESDTAKRKYEIEMETFRQKYPMLPAMSELINKEFAKLDVPQINIVMIARDRHALTDQALRTLLRNTAVPFNVVVVDDGTAHDRWIDDNATPEHQLSSIIESMKYFKLHDPKREPEAWINWDSQKLHEHWFTNDNLTSWDVIRVENGLHIVGQLRNLGAYWSEQRFGRAKYLCFCDNDIAFLPGWAERIIDVYGRQNYIQVLGGQRHPYHHCNVHSGDEACATDAVAGYHMFMDWSIWDKFGPFDANASGSGQSEDFAFCQKIREYKRGSFKIGNQVGYVNPPVIAHCGLTNTEGKPATGSEAFERIPGLLYE